LAENSILCICTDTSGTYQVYMILIFKARVIPTDFAIIGILRTDKTWI